MTKAVASRLAGLHPAAMRIMLLAAPFVASAALAQPTASSVEPELRPIPGTAPDGPAIVRFRPGPTACAGAVQRPTLAEEPYPSGRPFWNASREAAEGTVILRFRIDSTGRPLGIAADRPRGGPMVDSSDVAPAFAAWRFPPGGERHGCEIRFRIEAVPVADADEETLYRFLALHPASGQPRLNSVGAAAFARVRPAGGDCFTDRPNLRLQAYPPFERIAQPHGTVSYSFLTHDIGADGRTRDIRLVSSSGNAALDRESIAAVRRTRFQPSARTGCLHHFYRRQNEPMPAPALPDRDAYRPADATCSRGERPWASIPALVFPPAFNRRGVQGWAVVRYDVAASGATRNVTVVASEPAEAFGEQALRIVRAAREPAQDTAVTGCIARVIFRLPAPGEADPKGG